MFQAPLHSGPLEHHQPTTALALGPETGARQRRNSTAIRSNLANAPCRSRPPVDDDTGLRLAWLGYPQELSRNWGFWSSFSLSYINLGATSGTFWAYQTIYVLGGPISIFWGTILIAIVLLIQYMVLAELASAYPAAGAMFTWTFKLAHSNAKIKSWANFLSWTVAMYLFVSHLIFQVEDSWRFSNIVIRLFRLGFTHWKPGPWHLYSISCLDLVMSGAFMFTPISRSPRLWIGFAVITVTLSMIICTILVCSSTFRQSPATIFSHFDNTSQIRSNGWAFLVGASLLAAAGAENSAHMAEETHQAELVVPRAMFFATLSSYINVLVIQICCYMSFSEENTLNQTSILNLVVAHCSHHASAGIFSCLLVVTWIQQISQLLASTRFVWALARDNAFPFAALWRKLSTKSRMPRRATMLLVGLTIAVSCLLGVSQKNVRIFIFRSDSYLSSMCYLIPIMLYLLCDKDVLYRDGRNFWTLQRWSRPLALCSSFTLTMQMILGAFPVDPQPAGPQFPSRAVSSASIPLVALMAMVSWLVYGRCHYVGPIKSITVWTTGQEVELPRAANGVMSNPTSTEEGVGRRANVFEESIPMQNRAGTGQNTDSSTHHVSLSTNRTEPQGTEHG